MDDSPHHQATEVLLRMVNQIACNMAPGRSEQEAASATAEHLQRFWARSMKTRLIKSAHKNNQRLNPIAIQAISILLQHFQINQLSDKAK